MLILYRVNVVITMNGIRDGCIVVYQHCCVLVFKMHCFLMQYNVKHVSKDVHFLVLRTTLDFLLTFCLLHSFGLVQT